MRIYKRIREIYCDVCSQKDGDDKWGCDGLWKIIITKAADGRDVCNECRWRGVETRIGYVEPMTLEEAMKWDICG